MHYQPALFEIHDRPLFAQQAAQVAPGSDGAVQVAQQPPRPAKPAPKCLACSKPARVLTPGRSAVFCSAACKSRWAAGMNAWSTRYAAACDKADRQAGHDSTETLF